MVLNGGEGGVDGSSLFLSTLFVLICYFPTVCVSFWMLTSTHPLVRHSDDETEREREKQTAIGET